jgi:hypothetical protein
VRVPVLQPPALVLVQEPGLPRVLPPSAMPQVSRAQQVPRSSVLPPRVPAPVLVRVPEQEAARLLVRLQRQQAAPLLVQVPPRAPMQLGLRVRL